MIDCSAVSPLGGRFTRSQLFHPYDYTFFPAYFSPKSFDDRYGSGCKFFGSPVVPRSPSLYSESSSCSHGSYGSNEHGGKIGEFYGSSPAGEATQRTTSVIMKVEHQQVIELNAQDFHGRLSSDSEDELIVCKWENCYRRFDSLEQLAGHVTQAHATASGSGLYYCQWERCPRSDRGFNARYKMLVHARTHTKEKPHQCSECFKSFSRAENLKIHQRSHSGEKPYICPVGGCNKAYSNSSDRFKHTRTHSTDKPYACKFPSCNKRYTDPSSLRKHVKTFKHTAPAAVSVVESKNSDCADTTAINTDVVSPVSPVPSPSSHINTTIDSGDNVVYPAITLPRDIPIPANNGHATFYANESSCDCSSQCSYCSRSSSGNGDLFRLGHLFNHSVRITRDDESATDYWIEEKIILDNKECMDIDVPLDLSMHKSVR